MLWNDHQHMEDKYILLTAHSATWHRPYAADTVERTPYMTGVGKIAYHGTSYRSSLTYQLTSGRLDTYHADINRQTQGITKQLKVENALEWTGRLKFR